MTSKSGSNAYNGVGSTNPEDQDTTYLNSNMPPEMPTYDENQLTPNKNNGFAQLTENEKAEYMGKFLKEHPIGKLLDSKTKPAEWQKIAEEYHEKYSKLEDIASDVSHGVMRTIVDNVENDNYGSEIYDYHSQIHEINMAYLNLNSDMISYSSRKRRSYQSEKKLWGDIYNALEVGIDI